jgi:hypothetical protein
VKQPGTVDGGQTVGGSSGGIELSTARGSTEMISDGCPDANRKVLIKGIGESLLPTAQGRRLRWPGPTVTTPGTRSGHADLFCHLSPGQASVPELRDLLCGCGMCGRTGATHSDAGMG